MKLALVGATGLVGRVMMDVLEEEGVFPEEFYPVASSKSVGSQISFMGRYFPVMSMDEAVLKRPDIALFSAGGATSLTNAPRFAETGCYVIDNSSAWRMDETKKLIVPEVNGKELKIEDRIIANPNCSTIQMVMALAPLHWKHRIKRLVISTYQSVSGTGAKAVAQYNQEIAGTAKEENRVYPYEIAGNCLPHCDIFLDNGYTKEEMKLVHETRKILGDPEIAITATAVRVPVLYAHSESVNVEFYEPFTISSIKDALQDMPGVIIQDDPEKNEYPMPNKAFGTNEVYVGRIRKDDSCANGLNLWIVSDNLRKGAAWNAIQIMKELQNNQWIK